MKSHILHTHYTINTFMFALPFILQHILIANARVPTTLKNSSYKTDLFKLYLKDLSWSQGMIPWFVMHLAWYVDHFSVNFHCALWSISLLHYKDKYTWVVYRQTLAISDSEWLFMFQTTCKGPFFIMITPESFHDRSGHKRDPHLSQLVNEGMKVILKTDCILCVFTLHIALLLYSHLLP